TAPPKLGDAVGRFPVPTTTVILDQLTAASNVKEGSARAKSLVNTFPKVNDCKRPSQPQASHRDAWQKTSSQGAAEKLTRRSSRRLELGSILKSTLSWLTASESIPSRRRFTTRLTNHAV